MKDTLCVGPVEMMHRFLAIAKLPTKSAPDYFTSQMKEGNLTVDHFVEVKVVGTNVNQPTQNKFNNVVDKTFTPDLDCYTILDKDINLSNCLLC